ncbi:MAG: hypothetical protein SFY67_15175 [Candidatus Melainabacteria bacterium]|nr:hypothetical protein [Candidatus Melainabacteria bacterium]
MTRLLALLVTAVFLVFFGTGQLYCVCASEDLCGGVQNIFDADAAENLVFHHEKHNAGIVGEDCCKRCHSEDLTLSSIKSSDLQFEQVASCQRQDSSSMSCDDCIYQQHLGRSPPCNGSFVTSKIFLAKGSFLV